ncbi:MAG TPA: 3-phosphoshikimate 1-carboxyvinyltransferase, partial [Isosphaeraceae bacterium]|nr:3-phosphoshikimate 1-carboxyvinyltransferase [Isosphaeraceae bacterium]
MPDYPSELTVTPLPQAPKARVRVPGSKSITNRALIVAALAEGHSTLSGALDSDDTRVMVDSLQKLGFAVDHKPEAATIRITGDGGRVPNAEASLYVANSGTSLRFLTALVSLGNGTYRLDGTARMRQRPAQDLLMALNRLGADARSDQNNGCPPLTVRSDGLDGGHADVRGDVSSQFLSGLLMALPCARHSTTIEVQGTLVSVPYISMTLRVMESFGV